MNALAKSGNLRIETLRGLAILAIVAHHATLVLGSKLTELQLEPGLMRDIAGAQSGLFQPIRMPLFTLLSGSSLPVSASIDSATFGKANTWLPERGWYFP